MFANLKACLGFAKKHGTSRRQASFVSLLNSADQVTGARLLAAATKESGMWLHAVPLPSLGTQLYPESLRVVVTLRVGASVYEPHKCRYSSMMDTLGHHGLSCRFSSGQYFRQASWPMGPGQLTYFTNVWQGTIPASAS